jgi:hypothetical protein
MSQITSSVEKITSTQATLFLENNYDKQRPLRKWQVDFLSTEMKVGRFQPTANISFAHLNGRTYIVNGQHTLRAIEDSGITQLLPVIRHHIDGEDDLRNLYAHYDIGLKRTFADSVRVYGIVEQSGLSTNDINCLAAASKYMLAGFGGKPMRGVAHDVLIDLVLGWRPHFVEIIRAISPCEGKIRSRIRSRSIMSVALVTMKYNKIQATEFWQQVAQDEQLKRSDPRKTLNKRLYVISAQIAAGHLGDATPPAIQSRVAAHCWNKYYRGKGLTVIRDSMFNRTAPILIDGTPYTGEHLTPDD